MRMRSNNSMMTSRSSKTNSRKSSWRSPSSWRRSPLSKGNSSGLTVNSSEQPRISMIWRYRTIYASMRSIRYRNRTRSTGACSLSMRTSLQFAGPSPLNNKSKFNFQSGRLKDIRRKLKFTRSKLTNSWKNWRSSPMQSHLMLNIKRYWMFRRSSRPSNWEKS